MKIFEIKYLYILIGNIELGIPLLELYLSSPVSSLPVETVFVT